MVMVEVGGQEYSLDPKLKEKWDTLKDGLLAKHDEDRFYITDGQEGSGKSLFTLQQAAYIDPTIIQDEDGKVLPRICFTPEEFLYAIQNTRSTLKHTKVVIFDEAFRGLSSKGALSKNNKMLVQALMEARQNNLLAFIVSPSFYLIEFYAAVLRSQALFHVIKEKNTRLRFVRVFGKKDKAILYQIGVRKGWGYPRKTNFRVRFFNKYPGGDAFEKKYRDKKRQSVRDDAPTTTHVEKVRRQRDIVISVLYKKFKRYLPQREFSRILCANGFEISPEMIGKIAKKIPTTFDEEPRRRYQTPPKKGDIPPEIKAIT